ncbi:hypothetical protein NMG60_11022798 [Bertholletia excelsa]
MGNGLDKLGLCVKSPATGRRALPPLFGLVVPEPNPGRFCLPECLQMQTLENQQGRKMGPSNVYCPPLISHREIVHKQKPQNKPSPRHSSRGNKLGVCSICGIIFFTLIDIRKLFIYKILNIL